MARPTKQNVDYFSHDCDMRNDVKIKALRRKYKHLGYSIYIITLELLGDTEYFQMKWDDMNIELLASEYDCDTDELNDIIQYCIQLDLLQLTYGYLHCENFTKRLEETVLSRRKDYCSNNSPINKLNEVNVNNNEVIDYNNTQSKVKESKVNKSILEESKVKDSIEQETKVNNTEVKVYSFKFCNDIYNTITDDLCDDTEWLEALETADASILWNNFYSVLSLSETHKEKLKTIISERLLHLQNKHLINN
jgi:hypothetical protein